MQYDLDFDVYKRTLSSRLACEPDPTVRRSLSIVMQHVQCEIAGDLQGVMATLAPDPIYRLYNLTTAARQSLRTDIVGTQAVRDLYVNAIAEGTLMLQELNPRWLIADAGGVAFDASAKLAFSGKWLRDLGYQADPALKYLYVGRLCAFIMVNGQGEMGGEDVYFDPSGFEGITGRRIDEP